MSSHPATVRRWHATLIVGLVIGLAVGAAALGWWYARDSPPHQGPIVLISIDGLSDAEMGAYGAATGRTPGMDALAADGVVFERAYTHSPLVLPAHASLLTGLLPPGHGVRYDVGFTLGPDARTLPEMLASRGFATGAAVSSFLLRRDSGLGRGFRVYDDARPPVPDGEAPSIVRDARSTFDAAERWMRAQSGQRYFLHLQLPKPGADAVVGDLTASLKQRGLYDSATIVLVGDRGDEDPGPALDEATLRVPLIVKQPESQGAGARVAGMVQHADIVPTILDLVRAPIPDGLAGQSLRPVLDDPTEPVPATPAYAESLAGHYALGASAAYGMANLRHRLVRDTVDRLVPIDPPGPLVDAAGNPDAAPLDAALDSALAETTPAAPAHVPRADRLAFAAAGYFDGPSAIPSAEPPADGTAVTAAYGALRRAARLVAAGRTNDAVRALQPAVTAHPTLAMVPYQLGQILARAGRLDEAAVAFRRAAAAAPASAEISILLADTLRRAGRTAEARKQVDAALVLAEPAAPTDRASAHALAARIALEQKDAPAALQHAQEASEADTATPMVAFVEGRLALDEDRYEDAAAAFAKAVAELAPGGPALPELHASYGEALLQLQRPADAEAQFRAEIDAFPESPASYISLAMLLQTADRMDEVEMAVTQLLAALPTVEGYGAAIQLWTAVGERERANEVRGEARRRFQGDPALVRLGRAPRR